MNDTPRGKGTYRAIAAVLARRIEEGTIAPGAFLPTEKELQEEFQVTRTTIRRALSKLTEDGFVIAIPNRGVQARRRLENEQAIAFVDGASLVLRKLYAGLSARLLPRGLHLVHVDSEILGLESALELAYERGFRGAYVWSFEGFPQSERVREVARKMPVIALDHGMRGVETDLITLDYFKMASELIDHLAKQGRRRIGVTGMMDMLDVTQERFSGYMNGCFRNHIQPQVCDYTFVLTSGMITPDVSLLEARLRQPDRPDALFVMQDEFVPAVVEAALRAGLRIPEDLAIVSIGDDIVLSVGEVGLTATSCDWEHFADLALDRMVERLEAGPLAPVRKFARYRLEVRGSCGAKAPSSPSPTGTVFVHRRR